VAASGNRRLEMLVRRSMQIPMVLKAFSWYAPTERTVTNHQHRQIVHALERGDSIRAELVMTEHFYEGRDVILRALEGDSL
jgi:DNA-binding GntR family transcriptional regulator